MAPRLRCWRDSDQYDAAAPAEAWRERDGNGDRLRFGMEDGESDGELRLFVAGSEYVYVPRLRLKLGRVEEWKIVRRSLVELLRKPLLRGNLCDYMATDRG